jgi:hypothetical protein
LPRALLHRECARIFRAKRGRDDFGEPITLYRHQAEAIRAARGGANYVLTTGTGSGKSLSYLVPIVDQTGGPRVLLAALPPRPARVVLDIVKQHPSVFGEPR